MLTVSGVLAFLLGLVNRPLLGSLERGWSGISPWWSLAPVLLLGIYGLAKVNYQRYKALEEQLHRLQRKPGLSLVLDAGRPYDHEGIRGGSVLAGEDEDGQAIRRDRYFRYLRIGVKNESSSAIPDARVVLERLEPPVDHIAIEHPLQVMGAIPGTSRFAVIPSDVPTVFVDLVCERSLRDEDSSNEHPSSSVDICFASDTLSGFLSARRYTITLRAEGGEMSSRRRFILEKKAGEKAQLRSE